MEDAEKTKDQLISELSSLRMRIKENEEFWTQRQKTVEILSAS
ncbi:MAG: hypothetical protein H6Q53_303, partial [Deltaproteobacteria bacterium]|nr:hypothetical protein [Deltaproteobacteria bacterium]